MSTAIGTVTINAAFLQEIKEDNHELKELLAAAERTFSLDHRTHPSPRHLVELLQGLRDRLATHFSLEEAFGYFEEATSVAPHLSHQADELRSEHRTLYIELGELVEEAEQLLYHESPAGLAKRLTHGFREFYRRLRDHEARENEMILDSLDCDIGVGD